MRARAFLFVAAIGALAFTVGSSVATAQNDRSQRTRFMAHLSGFNEVPSRFSGGSGSFVAQIDETAQTIAYRLSYANLDGTTVLFSHVHVGQVGVSGGVSFFLCGGGTAPACPPAPATVTGTVMATDVLGPTTQGIAAGEFDKVVAAIRAGVTYANVHTDVAPAGEIRGQLR